MAPISKLHHLVQHSSIVENKFETFKEKEKHTSNGHSNGYRKNAAQNCVAIVGGGLVGSMAACFLAKRGYQVDLFEMRNDPRKTEIVIGKSINLALSERGRSALRLLGLEKTILDKYSIKMYSRMIHDVNGNTRTIPYGTKSDQFILSVSRRFLNEMLLDKAQEYKNVSIHFQHKLMDANLKHGQLTFQTDSDKNNNNNNNGEEEKNYKHEADIILGCDGAYSAVRRHMIKLLFLDYSQKYIEHGYLELCIPPTEDNDFAMPPNHLHIWPRNEFMMIALPNLDRSFTVTLFMPFKIFQQINDRPKLISFFEKYFPDSIPLLTIDGLCKTFFSVKPSPLISIKCKPYHYENKVLLMGDAAHAMVPFYGQGMNCGFEDCLQLDELLAENANSIDLFQRYTEKRVENCHAIIDLAMYNYVEMRSLVNKKSFLWRKWFDNCMYKIFPNIWIPLYTMVTFSRIPYRQCIRDKRWQDEMIDRFIKLIIFFIGIIFLVILAKYNSTLN